MTTRTDTLTVTGYVTSFKSDKGFGFADTQDLPHTRNNVPVFFHLDGAHKAHIEEGQAVLDDERDSDVYIPSRGPRTIVLLMEVIQTAKGWKAVRWGIRPGLRWVHDYIRGSNFNQFVGGTFLNEINGSRIASGKINKIDLTADTLTVVLTDGSEHRYNVAKGVHRPQHPRNGVITMVFGEHGDVQRTLTFAMPGFS